VLWLNQFLLEIQRLGDENMVDQETDKPEPTFEEEVEA
jgi:hypothetical protein